MITYQKVDLDLYIELASALHIGTGLGLARLLDDRTVRGPHARATYEASLPYIPGASLKGRLRACAREIAETFSMAGTETILDDLFGNAQRAGRLMFPDAHLVQEEEQTIAYDGAALTPYLAMEERVFVALSRVRRSAREKMLVRIDTASPGLHFETTIRGWLPDTNAVRSLALLALAARTTTHVGGHKGRGLGALQIAVAARIDRQAVSLDKLCEELEG